MDVGRRDLLKLLAVAAGSGLTPRDVAESANAPGRLLEMEPLGNVTLLHLRARKTITGRSIVGGPDGWCSSSRRETDGA
jgi:hypothetical protein